jgi:cysteine-rich repeat protein
MACTRTPLQVHRHDQGGDAAPAGNPATGGLGGTVAGTGGAPTATTADAAWANGGSASTGATTTTASRRTGGAVGTGGVSPTGGVPATGGSGAGGRAGSGGSGTGGRAGMGGAALGGAPSSGGRTGTGGAATGSGGRTGTGGAATGSGGRTGTGGAATGSGGQTGTGGVGMGGSVYDAGSTDAPAGTGGVTSSGGTMGRGGTGGTGPLCGDGIVDPGEQCDLGADNRASTAFSVTQAGLGFAPLPLLRSDSGAAFYDYRSASSHTGFEAVGTSRIMLYFDRSTFALSLVVFHGIDKDSTGEEQPESLVQMLFSGLPETTAINVGDESNELLMTSATTATGFWQYRENTDGGVLGGLPFPGDFTITIEPTFTTGISTWTWMGSDGSLLTLDPTSPLTIESRSSHGQCRPDCTVPTCGDGILDGGEICDDGQPSPSGCSINCQSFN